VLHHDVLPFPVRASRLMFLSAVALLTGLAVAGCEPTRTVRSESPAAPKAAVPSETAEPACAPGAGATSPDSCLGSAGEPKRSGSLNVLGTPLQPCPSNHQTGFYRDGFCNTGADDAGLHVVCARVTDDFLSFSQSRGNDLVTPRGGFPGLRPGDGWCLCARRWQEAFEAGVAPPVVLESTHQAALKVSMLSQLSGAKE
jgi:uncharacterized protein (DUF2237 family)